MRFEVDNSIGNNGQNNRWNESYIELRVWNQVKLWSAHLWKQVKQLRGEAW
mgnify:CR=1 FL=1